MRNLIFVFLLVAAALQGQTTFAPLGARWTYDMSHTQMTMEDPHWPFYVSVAGDTVVLGRSCSILRFSSSTFYYPTIGSPDQPDEVIVSTSGDTILLYTHPDTSFHPLMIFNAEPGDTWSIPIRWSWSEGEEPLFDTVTYVAQQCDTVWYEGLSLRRMQYTCTTLSQVVFSSFGPGYFVERLGDLTYLFPWYSTTVSDHDQFNHITCYADPVLSWPVPDEPCGILLGSQEVYASDGSDMPSVKFLEGALEVTLPPKGKYSFAVTDEMGRTLGAGSLPAGPSRIAIQGHGYRIVSIRDERSGSWTFRGVVL